jgi:F-type H+-transporting ATPase subunit delta
MKSIQVLVTSAIELSEEQLKKITSAVSSKYPKQKINVETTVDPNIIGGVKLVIDAVEYDGTVSGKLERLQQHLLKGL